MVDKLNSTEFFNNKNLIAVSKGLVNKSEEQNNSIYQLAKSLDKDNSKILEASETVASKLINLGSDVIKNIASMLGINLEQTSDSTIFNSYEDTYNDPILENYFKPFISDCEDSNNNLQFTQNHLSEEQLEYTYNAIVQDKINQGCTIINQDDNNTYFSDGTVLSYTNSNGNIEIYYDFTQRGTELQTYGSIKYDNNNTSIELYGADYKDSVDETNKKSPIVNEWNILFDRNTSDNDDVITKSTHDRQFKHGWHAKITIDETERRK